MVIVTSAGLADVRPPPSCAVIRSFRLAAPRWVRAEVRKRVPVIKLASSERYKEHYTGSYHHRKEIQVCEEYIELRFLL